MEVADNVETCVAGFYMSLLSFEGYFLSFRFLLLFSFLFLPVDLLPLHYCTEFQSLALRLDVTAYQKLFLCIWVWFCVFLCM